jgi:hypothetical protein
VNQALSYSIKVWLTTIVFSPILSTLTILIDARNFHDVINISMLLLGLPLTILLIGVITIPSAIVFYFSSLYLLKKDVTSFSAKIILSIIGFLLTCLSINIFGDFKFTSAYLFIISPYLLVIMISIWIHRFKKIVGTII